MTWSVETVRDGAAKVDDVFRHYAEPSTWPDWGHGARSAHADGPMVEGGTVAVRGKNGMRYVCVIRRLEAEHLLELEVRTPGMVTMQTYEVERRGEGVRVRHALEISGPLSGIMKIVGVPARYQRALDREVEKVIEMADATGASTA